MEGEKLKIVSLGKYPKSFAKTDNSWQGKEGQEKILSLLTWRR